MPSAISRNTFMRKGCKGLLSISENKGGHKKASSAHRKNRSHPDPNRKTAVDQRFNRPKEFVWQAFPFSPKNPTLGRKGADGPSTDVGVSMGEPVEVWAERINDLAAYQINQNLMNIAGPRAVFMHCLPAYHDHKTTVGREMGERFGRDAMEVTDEVFEGPQSIVFDEAENRMHTIKAVMAATLGYKG